MRKPLRLNRKAGHLVGSAFMGLALVGAPPSAGTRVSLQHEHAGRNQGWTDVTDDSRATVSPITFSYGITGTSPLDRVAGIGTLQYALNNYSQNSQGKEGAYSPGHPNCRTGFRIGIGCRLALIQNVNGAETTYYKWRGTIDSIRPQPGANQNHAVAITAVDFMDEFARFVITGIPTQLNQRGDQLFQTLIDALPRKPPAIQTTEGIDTFQYAFNNQSNLGSTGEGELQNIAMSELALIYPKGDTTQGGTLVFEGRRTRGRSSTNVQVFDNTMNDMAASRSRGAIFNRVKTTNHQRVADAVNTTELYSLPSRPQVSPGDSLTFTGYYRDPAQLAATVSAIDQIDPGLWPGVDYAMNTVEDGSGLDITSQFTVTATMNADSTDFTVTNNGPLQGFVVLLRQRGRGLYDYLPSTQTADDLTSQINFGQNEIQIDMPYQGDPVVGLGAARYFLGLYKDDVTSVDRFGFMANASSDLMKAMLVREISDRIGIREQVTGLTDVIAGSSATRGFFINSIEVTITVGPIFMVTYTLAPADQNAYWQLAIPGNSELNQTTLLGFGLFAEHVDSPHVDDHTDSAHVDTAHTDTHGDVAHGDAAHGDASHADVPHGDSAHGDLAHTDTHDDVAHADAAHLDSHSDAPHTDVHTDQAHDDFEGFIDQFDPPSGHADNPHQDEHLDVSHGDDHQDTSHVDAAHVDNHGDVSHIDASHADVAHADDSSHVDAGHLDTAHTDTHADVSHVDVAHGDAHSDVNHGDGFV